MHRHKPTAHLLPFFAISLTACQNDQVQTQIITLPPPALPALLLLPTEGPYRPPSNATQRDAALVIEDFTEALGACNADKKAIARIFEEYENGTARQPR
jgi:hypothetical protein